MRILIVQRSLSPPGGGNAVAAWMVHALARDHDVATMTARRWPVAGTNAFYGTAIPERGVTQHVAPAPWSWLDRLPEDRATRLRMAAVLRYARPLAQKYDLLITADNFASFTMPGMQYVHFPAPIEPTAARLAALVNVYFALADALAGIPSGAAANNVTLANSMWTAEGLERRFGINARVLYPPVVDPGPGLAWPDRADSFLCIGRFTPSKRIETAIAIVQRVRAGAMPHARLIVVGSAVDREYTATIKRTAGQAGDWIEFAEDLSRQDTNRLIGRCRYAIQAMVGEHFGMATAELAKGGCLVFAHDSGGTPEVLGDPALLWRTEDEAVTKITALIADAEANAAARQRLAVRSRQFTTDRFCEELRQLAEAWISK